MLKGLASDITGSSDICVPVRDLSKCLAAQYVLPGESIMFALQSSKEEFSFTNQALIRVEGSSATTTRKLVERFEYKSHPITHVKFETAGRVDRDCEIKFMIGTEKISIDIATAEEPEAIIYYKVLALLGRQQHTNSREWEFANAALGHAASALRLREGVLTTQAEGVTHWLHEQYKKLQPRCYREVIAAAMQEVRTNSKMMQ
ncbi:hypothetical protein P43SY_009464 [Pythium insidiosum]|uniref:Bacterial Pleckstrin homology domain-containing protein n=1 Tax=Pythium insidiosum TaxID=114742 RepID=A0AAD5Q8I4_PYTIN|nr:hypothetical protein P43SY_009464 [Pythium insidiosum]